MNSEQTQFPFSVKIIAVKYVYPNQSAPTFSVLLVAYFLLFFLAYSFPTATVFPYSHLVIMNISNYVNYKDV